MTVADPISWRPEHDADALLASVPPGGGVYRLVPVDGEPHISSCAYLAKRVARLARHFGARLRSLDCWPTSSRLETLLVVYKVTRDCFPDDYAKRLRLRAPWFVTWTESDPFPHLLTTARLSSTRFASLGPFRDRDEAHYFIETVSNLFQVRRCTGLLQPSSDHPGCIYGEMSQCLRPCQLAVNESEYASEVERVIEFLQTRGRPMLRTLTMARNRASEEMDFEAALHLHKRIEKIREVLASRDDVIEDARRFSGVALTKDSRASACRLHLLWHGCWQDSFAVDFGAGAEGPSEATSIDTRLREQFSRLLSQPRAAERPVEHLALFSRWFRSTWRDGEWFPFQTLEDLNYRKLVRHMSKLVKCNTPAC